MDLTVIESVLPLAHSTQLKAADAKTHKVPAYRTSSNI